MCIEFIRLNVKDSKCIKFVRELMKIKSLNEIEYLVWYNAAIEYDNALYTYTLLQWLGEHNDLTSKSTF